MLISVLTSKVKGSLSDLFWKYCQNSPFNLPQFFVRPTCSWNDCSSPEYSLVGWSHVPECFFEPWISSKFRVGEPSREAYILKIRQKFRFNPLSNFTPAISRGNKAFWFPAENIWQNLRCWKCDGMWSSVFDKIYTQVRLSWLKLKLRRRRWIKITTSRLVKIRYANITVMIFIV